jgi:benzoyl-CoA reductase/2-hydroxyglutaryl-CoA dehydratase subunit BcrC/BadD/HgdB
MTGADEILAGLRALVNRPVPEPTLERARAGVPVVGLLCSYVPADVLRAAGAIPLRLRAPSSDDSTLGDAYLSTRTCTFVRHVLSEALRGTFDVLAGEVSTNGCDHVRRGYDVFSRKTGIRWHGFLSVPRASEERLFGWYREEVERLAASLADALGTSVTAESLRAAIATGNEIRAALRTLESFSASREPRLSGAEMLVCSIAAQVLPADVFLEHARRLAETLASRPARPGPGLRVVMVGASLDAPSFVDDVERCGVHVAADQLCFGGRTYRAPVASRGDPMEAICRHAFFGVSCARMIGGFSDRLAALRLRMAETDARAVVFQRLKFCDPWGAEQHMLEARLREERTPMLVLDREYNVPATGQVHTRVQALVEVARTRAEPR